MVLRFFITALLLSGLIYCEDKIGVYEKLNDHLPLDLKFTNEYNVDVTLKEAFSDRPVILTLNYFDCPSLCSPQLHGLSKTLNQLDMIPYVDYKVVTISIHKEDSFQSAMKKKVEMLKTINKAFPPQTWSFLTSDQQTIDDITERLGYKYQKRIKDGVVDYLHPGVIMVISPEGKIARYLNGVTFLPFDLKLAILEANEERSGPTIAKTLLYCFAYDAEAKTYVFQAEKVVGSFIFAIVLGFFIYLVKTGRKKG